MGSAVQFVKTTVVGGLVFLVPLVILLLLVAKATELLGKLSRPVAPYMSVGWLPGTLVAGASIIALIVLACFLAGLLARLSFANRFIKRAEAGVLWRVPGYGLVKGLTDSLDERTANTSLRPVLAHFDDCAQLAFEVDALADGRKVVYLPSSPDPRSGSVMVMEGHRVERVPMTFMSTIRVLRALGRGAGPPLSGPAPG
jgi:uncharacterized membrane protein